jgi:SanA protein
MRRVTHVLLRLAVGGLAVMALLVGVGWLALWRQVEDARPFMTSDVGQLPEVEVGLVLGMAPTYSEEGITLPNESFEYRLDAAAALWEAGKVGYLLVSGNRTGAYDEPTVMRQGLIERGVPGAAIYRDFAGFRTNDSIRRARTVFGQTRLIVVSQADHVARALLLAKAFGVEAWGLEARAEERRVTLRDRLGLAAWALRARWDVWWRTPARRSDPPVAIGVDPPN